MELHQFGLNSQRVASEGKFFSVQASAILGRTESITFSGPTRRGILYFAREAASSFLNIDWSLTSTTALENHHIVPRFQVHRYCWLVRKVPAFRDARAVPKYNAPSSHKPHTGIECGRPSCRALQIQ